MRNNTKYSGPLLLVVWVVMIVVSWALVTGLYLGVKEFWECTCRLVAK